MTLHLEYVSASAATAGPVLVYAEVIREIVDSCSYIYLILHCMAASDMIDVSIGLPIHT